jgi:transcription-repair coupling factor (superfamily II helicase)
VQTHSSICKMKEKQTPAGLRLLLTFDNVKNTRTALEFMEMLGSN